MLINRLLSIGILLFVAVSVVCVYSDGVIIPLIFVIIAVSCCLLCAIRLLRLKTAVILAVIPIVSLLYTITYSALFIPKDNINATAEAVITEGNSYFRSNYYVAKIEKSDCGDILNFRVSFYSDCDYDFGDIVLLDGAFISACEKPSKLGNGIYYTYSGSSEFSGKSDGLLLNIRKTIADKTDEYVSDDVSGIIKAITVAERFDISVTDYSDFSKTASSHLLAVSGLHLSVIMGIVGIIFGKILKNKYIRCLLQCVFVFCFCALAGFPYSAIRAGIMLCLTYIGGAISAQHDSVTSLFAAVGILVIINPYSACSLSLQLSFLSTLGILAVSGSFNRGKNTRLKRFVSEIFISPVKFAIAANLFTLPVVIFSFDIISVISPVTSIIVSVLFLPLLISSYIFCVLSVILPFTAAPLGWISGLFCKLLKYIIKFFASFDFASVAVYEPLIPFICIITVTSLVLILVVKRKHRMKVFVSSVAAMCVLYSLCFIIPSAVNKYGIYFEDYYNGYGIACNNGSDCVYIDYGCNSIGNECIYKTGNTTCDTLILRNPGSKAGELVEYFAECMKIEKIYLPEDTDISEEIENEILYLANKYDCDIMYYGDGVIRLGNISLFFNCESVQIVYRQSSIILSDYKNYHSDNDYMILPTVIYGNNYSEIHSCRYIHGSRTSTEKGDDIVYGYNKPYSLIP